jgi:tetratricopeptide (TPR) repeat protein
MMSLEAMPSQNSQGRFGDEPLVTLLGLSKEEILQKGSAAEFDQHWDFAVLCFHLYLTKDPDSKIAQRVREELDNIRWRSQVLFTRPDYFDEQTREFNRVRLLYDLGLWEEAAREAVRMIRDHPDQSRTYFLASASLVKMGRYEDAKDCLTRGWVRFSEREQAHALQLMIQVDREERKTLKLREISVWLKESKFRDADGACRSLTEEFPEDPQIRQSAIRTAVLAGNYEGAMKLIEAPLRFANGETREMPPETREKLATEIRRLMQGSEVSTSTHNPNSPKAGTIQKPSAGSSGTKKSTEKSASMAQDFLNRIKK